jgi:hypothetical protein
MEGSGYLIPFGYECVCLEIQQDEPEWMDWKADVLMNAASV